MPIQIQYRRGTAAEWTAANTLLSAGEPGYETDTGKFKVGDGSTAWNSLAYSSGIQGTQGTQGRSYIGVTSTTSNTIAVGSKTFSVSNSGAFGLGQRVRAANTAAPANYVEGSVTAITSDTSITINADVIGGTGTFTAWTFSTAGVQGVQGPQGLLGVQGPITTNTNFTGVFESIQSVSAATAATTTYNVYCNTANTLYYTTASTAASTFTINVAASAATTLTSVLGVGQSVTVVFLNTTGAVTTSYPASPITIDGSSANVTMRWVGGVAPASGNASSIDAYTYTIIKTAATPAYTVLAQQTKWA